MWKTTLQARTHRKWKARQGAGRKAFVPGVKCERLMGAMPGTMNCSCTRAIRTVMAAMALAASVPAFLPTVRAGQEGAGEATRETGTGAGPANADYVELQQQINELRSDLLDEREWRIRQQLEANGAVLLVLGIVIGIGGLWFYAKFRVIAAEARIGASAERHYSLAPQGLPLGSAEPRTPPGKALRPLPLLVSPRLEADPDGPAKANGNSSASPIAEPGLHAYRRALPLDGPGSAASPADIGSDTAELQRIEEAIADCTETIRLDPGNPRLYLERADARSRLDCYEEAIADYDRAIALDPDSVAAYLGRCHAKSELGRHEEAIEDYDHAVHLDPDSASASGEG